LVAVPATVGDQTLTVTYRVTVVLDAGDRPEARKDAVAARGTGRNGMGVVGGDRYYAAWGYAEVVPVRVSSERKFDMVIDHGET
jgi:hypothetical protein